MSNQEGAKEGRVLIVPCSGIGKAFGSVGREATYVVVEELRPEESGTVCLARLTLDDEESHALVRGRQTIAVDGCPKACARISIEQAGGAPSATFRVFDVFRAHKELRVAQVSDIGDSGRELAHILAEEIAAKVDELRDEKKSEEK